jgi:hypothetical protein
MGYFSVTLLHFVVDFPLWIILRIQDVLECLPPGDGEKRRWEFCRLHHKVLNRPRRI